MNSILALVIVLSFSASANALTLDEAKAAFDKADSVALERKKSIQDLVRPMTSEPYITLESAFTGESPEAAEYLSKIAAHDLHKRAAELTYPQLELRLLIIEMDSSKREIIQRAVEKQLKNPLPLVRWRALMALRRMVGSDSPSYQIEALNFLDWANQRDYKVDSKGKLLVVRDFMGKAGERTIPRARVYFGFLMETAPADSENGLLVLEALNKSNRFYNDQLLIQVLKDAFSVYFRNRQNVGTEDEPKIQVSKALKAFMAKVAVVANSKNVIDPVVDAGMGLLAGDQVLGSEDSAALNEYITRRLNSFVDENQCEFVLRREFRR